MSRYRFGTGTADFLLCSRCGAVACAVFNLDDQNYAVLNTRILDGQKTLGDDIASANYDAEDTAERLERRKNNWIPRVNIETRS